MSLKFVKQNIILTTAMPLTKTKNFNKTTTLTITPFV